MNKDNSISHRAIKWISTGAFLFALYVTLSAFGAHGLKERLTDSQLVTYNTGMRYFALHAFGLIIVNISYNILNKFNYWVNWFFIAGLVFFSGGLALHATQSLFSLSIDIFGALAPIGGLCFIIGWIIFGISIRKK